MFRLFFFQETNETMQPLPSQATVQGPKRGALFAYCSNEAWWAFLWCASGEYFMQQPRATIVYQFYKMWKFALSSHTMARVQVSRSPFSQSIVLLRVVFKHHSIVVVKSSPIDQHPPIPTPAGSHAKQWCRRMYRGKTALSQYFIGRLLENIPFMFSANRLKTATLSRAHVQCVLLLVYPFMNSCFIENNCASLFWEI